MSRRTTMAPLGPLEIEKAAQLVPTPTDSPGGYAFHRPRPKRDTIPTPPPVPHDDDDSDLFPEITVSEGEGASSRAVTIELPQNATIPTERDAFFLSEEIIRLLKQPQPDVCWCSGFDEAIGKVFTGSDDGRFLMLRPGMSEREPIVRKLTAEQQVRGLMRLAIRVCPFDGYKMDPSIPVIAWAGSEDEPPLCCAWMAHATLVAGRVRFSDPHRPRPYANFVDDEDQHLPFLYCPSCATSMSVLTKQRQAFFRRHRL
ncbi:MAG: hypothetical protein QY323_00320 [Patescibacteria group bacterium]|nr:MAG: hypothetical protein QY323_00320 [Patescibacteria group bacterium]